MGIELFLCRNNQTLKNVLEVINTNCKGISFVLDEQNKMCGIITDGDIRRALLRGAVLDEFVEKYMNTDFVYALNGEIANDILDKFNCKVKIIPIIDAQGTVIDWYEYRNDIHIPVAQPQLEGNELKYLTDALLSTWISSTGKYITEFENKFSAYCGAGYGVAVSNGTTALHLALVALGIGEGDEVIVPNLTFAATINAVLYTGAKPVIVDIEEDSWCIDPNEIKKAITENTKAIIPVHLYGQPCNMDLITKIAQKYNLFIVEDCAEAHGASYDNKKVGALGDIGCFSFFGNKVITTGEGGMCITNNIELYNKMKILRDHGMSKKYKYYHDMVGFNYRMTNMQAAIGVAQFEKIDNILEKRKKLEEKYQKMFKNVKGIQWQTNTLQHREKIVWLVSALVPEQYRDRFILALKEENIDARPFFIPLSRMEIYEKYMFSEKNSIKISKQGINFPTILSLEEKTMEQIRKVWNTVFKGELL